MFTSGASPTGGCTVSIPPLAGPGGDIPCTFLAGTQSRFLGLAQRSVLTKNICDWDITKEKGFLSSNGGFRNLAVAACSERLLPSANLSEFEQQYFEKSQGDRNKIDRDCLYFYIVSIAFSLLSFVLILRRRNGRRQEGHIDLFFFFVRGGGGQQC